MAWETFPHPYTSPQNHLWIFETLWVIIFWVRVTHKMSNVMHKNLLSNFICHLSWLKKLSPTYTHPLVSIHEFSKPYELLFFELRVTHKMLNVTCIQIHSIILSVTCHSLRNFPPLIHIPSRPFVNFWHPISYYFFELRVTHKMLNVNCMKIHSVILSVTCHDLRNFPLLIHIPSKPFVNFRYLTSYYFLS